MVGSAYRGTGISHFDSKWEIEKHVRQNELPYTILRPVFFMQNWEMMRDQILDGTLAQPLDPDKPLQQLNVENLLNKAYFPTANSDNNIAPGAPRNARLTLRANF